MITKRVIPIFAMVVYLPALSFFSFMFLKAGFLVEGAICAFAILVLGTPPTGYLLAGLRPGKFPKNDVGYNEG